MHACDPHSPGFTSWIDKLPPHAELVTRLAMRAVFPECRKDRFARARVNALIALVAPDTASLARALAEADHAAAMLRLGARGRAA